MDYEKKYKETLEKARQLCAYPTTKPFISDLQNLFPELKESEGERIRKWCISLIKATCDYDSPTSRKEVDDALAWLEKQGEQKPEWGEEDEAARKDIIDKLERIKMTVVGSECNICQKEIDWLKSLESRCFPQKQEWSDAEEFELECILCHLKEYLHEDAYKGYENWLKSLRPQNTWKPSDEQMDALETATSSLQSTALESLYNDLQKLKG